MTRDRDHLLQGRLEHLVGHTVADRSLAADRSPAAGADHRIRAAAVGGPHSHAAVEVDIAGVARTEGRKNGCGLDRSLGRTGLEEEHRNLAAEELGRASVKMEGKRPAHALAVAPRRRVEYAPMQRIRTYLPLVVLVVLLPIRLLLLLIVAAVALLRAVVALAVVAVVGHGNGCQA